MPQRSLRLIPWVSAAVLLGLLSFQDPIYGLLWRHDGRILLLAAAPLTLLGCAFLWIRGLGEAGQGLGRVLFCTALAGSLTEAGVSITQFAGGFRQGWLQAGAPQMAPRAPANPSWTGLLDWLFLTGILAAILHRLARHRQEAERQRQEAERQRALALEAREAALRARLAPHFIFNCLNTLKAQIDLDPTAAAATTDRLASLFRQVLEVSVLATHPLGEELTFVENYLGIEKARLGDRLQVDLQVPEALEACEIPPLSLQVLVENAVRHGVAPREAGGLVRIGADLEGNLLTLWVEDPGTGLGEAPGTGTALATLRQRLAGPGDLELGLVADRHRATMIWRQA